MFRFIIYALGILFLLSLLFGASTIGIILRLLFGRKRKPQNTNRGETTQKPESQTDRIITYKKKEFETSAAEDVEFEEIKDKKK